MSEKPHYLRTASVEDGVQFGLSEAEFKSIIEKLGREISLLEAGIFSALYSEHCSYKSTKVHLKNLPTEGPRVLIGPGENAGVVDIGDGQAIAFKVESHNHPSFIEPFQGAATGVGGILRDVFTMGARPLALLNSLRFGDPKHARVPYLFSRAVHGIGSYGNCMGVPTIGGELFFHESYNGNCLVNAFALGLVDQDKIFLGCASGIGNSVIYLGSKTGRDGIHGATMASAEFDDNSAEKRPTVQVGDPFQEKLLLEACLEIMQSGAVIGIQDMGAAGMTSSSYEMAARAGTGLRIDLDKVPQRETGMNPYEIMLSESQERMLLIAEKGREEEVYKIVSRWELDAVKIGEVVEGNTVDLYWHAEKISSIPVDVAVNSAPQYRWPEQEPGDFQAKIEFEVTDIMPPQDLSAAWLKLISSPNLCSRYPVYRQYDSTVRSNTVVHPGSDCGVIRIKAQNGVEKGIAIKLDCNSRFCGIDPFHGAALSVAEGVRNVTAVGATPVGLSDCLNLGSPDRPEGMWVIAQAIRGLGEACRAFKVPIVSGNVSLYNETKGQGILPTPTLATVGLLADASKALSAQFVSNGDKILVLGDSYEEFGGSEYMAQIAGVEKGALPKLDYDLEIKTANLIRALISERLLKSCHDVSSGGIATALAECCFGTYKAIGAKIKLEVLAKRNATEESERKDTFLFAESGARYIVSLAAKDEARIRKLITDAGVIVAACGTVGGNRIVIEDYAELDLEVAYQGWSNGLNGLI